MKSVYRELNQYFNLRLSPQDIPIVVAGNKVDVVREIEIEEVEDWVSSQLSKDR